jgi:hypothetical protein
MVVQCTVFQADFPGTQGGVHQESPATPDPTGLRVRMAFPVKFQEQPANKFPEFFPTMRMAFDVINPVPVFDEDPVKLVDDLGLVLVVLKDHPDPGLQASEFPIDFIFKNLFDIS